MLAAGFVVPSALSSGDRSWRISPWGDQSDVHAKIATVLAARTLTPRSSSVAELTERQTTSVTTELQYIPHKFKRSRSSVSRNFTRLSKAGEDEEDDGEEHDFSRGARCGESWDDAAVKCGQECLTGCGNTGGICYKDLPTCDHKHPAGRCWAFSGGVSDSWCATAAASISGDADGFYKMCICEEVVVGKDTMTDKYVMPPNATELPKRDAQSMALVKEQGDIHPGLPDCVWRPEKGCSNVSQYECIEGPSAGQCSGDNWYYSPKHCSASCVHTSLLSPPPYYAIWRTGPRARPWPANSELPHYAAKNAKLTDQKTLWAFDHPKKILMSVWCKSSQIEFVGVSLFSPAYEEKARRLLGSCNLNGVCCKATMVGSDFMGASTPEGSDEFRFRMIALKPLFLLDQMDKTQEPVIFLDVDLEFHQFPELFVADSWPDGTRDVALFNFWANETNMTYRHTPNIGSAVAYFNQTYRAKKLLTAWAEAMQYSTNSRAPDDQVLDKLLKEGGWLERVSLGWLPASYLRTMPAYYRGVNAVIDHDVGTAPGVAGHSEMKPKLPPVLWREQVNEAGYMDAAAAAAAVASAADPNSVDSMKEPPDPWAESAAAAAKATADAEAASAAVAAKAAASQENAANGQKAASSCVGASGAAADTTWCVASCGAPVHPDCPSDFCKCDGKLAQGSSTADPLAATAPAPVPTAATAPALVPTAATAPAPDPNTPPMSNAGNTEAEANVYAAAAAEEAQRKADYEKALADAAAAEAAVKGAAAAATATTGDAGEAPADPYAGTAPAPADPYAVAHATDADPHANAPGQET
jgi:hypothetical protein